MLVSDLLFSLALCFLVYEGCRLLARQGYWALLAALHSFKCGRLDKALLWIGRCLEAPKLTPRRRARAHYLRALIHLQRQQKTRAVHELRLARRGLRNEFWPNLMLGLTLVEMHEAQEALRPLLRASRLQPRDARAWFGLGWAYARLRRLEDAHAALDQCLSREPQHRRALELQAEVCLQLSLYDAALSYLDRLGELYPRLWMGQRLLNWSRHDEALFWLERQLEHHEVPPTRTLIAAALREQGKVEESIQQYNIVLSQKLCWQALWGRALGYLQTLERCTPAEQERRMTLIRRDIAWADELSGGGCRDLLIQRAKIGRELLPVSTKTYVN